MNVNNEALPGNPGSLGDNVPQNTEALKQAIEALRSIVDGNPNCSGIAVYIFNKGSQKIDHLDAQYIYNGDQGEPLQTKSSTGGSDDESKLPPPEVMARAVDKTLADGYWWGNVSWSVVYRVYQMKGYQGSISQFVRDVATWPFKRPISYVCNDDSVGKPVRSGKLSRSIDLWKADGAPALFGILGGALMSELKTAGY